MLNCTNHEIILDLGDHLVVLPPSGQVARIVLRQHLVECIDDVPIYENLPATEFKGLPDPKPGEIYITSAAVAQNAKRPDVVCPNHAVDQHTRDHNGRVVSVKSLLRYFSGDEGTSPDPTMEAPC